MAYGYDIRVEFDGQSVADDHLVFLKTRIKALGPEFNTKIQATTRRAARQAERILKAELPKGPTKRLRGSVRINELTSYAPGGSGGGGNHTSTVSVGEGVPYSPFVFKGTGLYGPKKKPIRQRMGGEHVLFNKIKYGKNPSHWISYSAGQKPNTKAIDNARRAANRIMARSLSEISGEIALNNRIAYQNAKRQATGF